MREIKFRVFDRTNKCFKYAIFDNGGWDFEEAKFIQPNTEWMQYIGLKDRNGKAIYEGDIIKANKKASLYEYGVRKCAYFYIDYDGGCSYSLIGIKPEELFEADFALHDIYSPDFTVMGNIYENPELLEK